MRDRNTGWQPKTYTAKTYTPHVYPKTSSVGSPFTFDTDNHFELGKLISFSNNGVEKAYVNHDGSVVICGGDASGNDSVDKPFTPFAKVVQVDVGSRLPTSDPKIANQMWFDSDHSIDDGDKVTYTDENGVDHSFAMGGIDNG